MGKFKNTLKRNRGFLVLCVLAGGASFATADMAMSDMLPDVDLPFLNKIQTEVPAEGDAALTTSMLGTAQVTDAVEEQETEILIKETYETDPFTITSSGSVIKGVEGEASQTEAPALPEVSETQPDAGEGQTDPAVQNVEATQTEAAAQPETQAQTEASQTDAAQTDAQAQPETTAQTETPQSETTPQSEELIIEGTPNDVVLWGISSRYIDESELYVMDEQALRLMRNEIFALHGRIFTSEDLNEFFSKRSWYKPTVDPDYFDANMNYILNDYELANLETIYAYEQTLKYGDEWWEWEE